MGAGAVGVIVVLVVVLIVLLAGRGGSGLDKEALAAAGCVAEDFREQERDHIQDPDPSFEYNSFPPTSGPHHSLPAVYNFYDAPVEEINLIHNLEHGALVIQYGDKVAPAEVEAIRAWWAEDPNGIIVAQLPDLGSKIALGAWTHLLTCSKGFDAEAFSDFRDEYRFKGPERFSPDAMAPGSQ